jgi:hypothetical protein
MNNNNNLQQFSASYKLNDKELNKLLTLLLNETPTTTGFESSVYAILKELNFDVPRFIRLLLIDKDTDRPIFVPSILWRFTTLLKEVIIIIAFEEAKLYDKPISIVNLTRTARYKALGIDRNFIYRTVMRYNLKYNKRAYQKST